MGKILDPNSGGISQNCCNRCVVPPSLIESNTLKPDRTLTTNMNPIDLDIQGDSCPLSRIFVTFNDSSRKAQGVARCCQGSLLCNSCMVPMRMWLASKIPR